MKFKAPRSLGASGRDALLRTAKTLFNEQCAIAILASLPERMNSQEREEQIDALAMKSTGELKAFVKSLRENVEQARNSIWYQIGSGQTARIAR
jgi:hypothetical protein